MPPPIPPSVSGAGARRRGAALVLMVLGVLLALAVLTLLTHRSWQQTQEEVSQKLQRLAQLNAGSLAIVLRKADRLEAIVWQRLQRERPRDAALVSMLRDELSLRFSSGETAEIFAASGALLASTAAQAPPPDLAAQFRRLAGPGSSVVGWAYERAGAWWLPVLHRAPTGETLVVNIPLQEILAVWGSADEGDHSPVGLRGADDVILVRQPFQPSMLGADASPSLSARLIGQAVADGARAGVLRTTATETDRVERWIGWSLVPGSRLRTLVALDHSRVVAGWWRHTGIFASAIAALIVASAATGGVVIRRLMDARWRAEQAEITQRRSLALVEQALDASRDTTWQVDREGRWLFAADLGWLLDGEPPSAGKERQSLEWLLDRLEPGPRAALHAAAAALHRPGGTIDLPLVVRPRHHEPGNRSCFVLRGRCVAAAGSEVDIVAVGTFRDLTQITEASSRHEQMAAILQRMCTLARIGHWAVELEGERLTMSAEARRLYRLEPDTPLPGWQAFVASQGEHQARLQAARRRLLQTGEGYDEVVPLAGTELRWVRSVAVARRDASGRMVGVDGAVQEVTDLVQTRRALDAASWRSQELAAAMAASTQLVLITDAEQRITWCNGAFTRCTGWSLDEVTGQLPGPLLQRDDVPPDLRRTMREAIAQQRGFRVQRLPNHSRHGKRYWVDLEVQPILDQQGRLKGYVGVQTDVTRDIEREAQLRDVTLRFERATQGARIGIWEHRYADDQVQWNDVMFELLGLDPGGPPVDTERFLALLHPEDLGPHRASYLAALGDAACEHWRGEFRMRRAPAGTAAGASWRWIRAIAAFERDGAGGVLRGVGTMTDVTAERELQREQSARATAEARAEATTAFLSRMSHELRTPLNAVIGYAQLIRAEALGEPERVQHIERAGWHLLSLIDDILDLSRIEAGTLRMQPRSVSLSPLLHEATDFVLPLSQRHRVTLALELDGAEMHVLADPTRLRQVMLNLVSNAIKYNRPGGRVVVAAQRQGDAVRIRVVDNGLGMSEAQRRRLFVPFERLGREQQAIEGTGLGLAITDALVRAMHGRIEVDSVEGEGSVFTLSLPAAAKAEEPAATQALPMAATPGGSRAVLCVEDNEVNALMFGEAMRHLRPAWACQHAGSLTQARGLLGQQRFDIVFADLQLPDGDGLSLVGARSGQVSPSRVVLLSADASDQAQRRAVAMGVTRRLPKPFRLEDLDRLLLELDQELAGG